MIGERKKFGLRATPRPRKNEIVSSVVVVNPRNKELFHCYIAFANDFIQFVGSNLPRGVSTNHPAFIQVVEGAEEWLVFARYEKIPAQAVLLWSTKTRPIWIIERKSKVQNGKTTDEN